MQGLTQARGFAAVQVFTAAHGFNVVRESPAETWPGVPAQDVAIGSAPMPADNTAKLKAVTVFMIIYNLRGLRCWMHRLLAKSRCFGTANVDISPAEMKCNLFTNSITKGNRDPN